MMISRLASEAEARRCAEIMSGSEPWITLGRGYEESLAIMRDSSLEIYTARPSEYDNHSDQNKEPSLLGFIILQMTGAFVGYIKSVAVASHARGNGVGTALLRFAEERIFGETPNVFICVSSFNPSARALYERLGYEVVGELRDFIVFGHSEILLRKTIAPLRGFQNH